MSETKHSPEPWVNDDTSYEHVWSILDADGNESASARGEDRRRIVACVNACAGIPTEALEAGALAKALDALVAADRADNSCDEYRPQCPWCGAAGRGGYACCEEEEPHAPECKRTAALRALGRLKP